MKATQLLTWIRRDLVRFSTDDNYEVAEQSDDKVIVRFYTEINKYTVVADAKGGEGDGYLGAVSRSRKPRAGEDWTRGNDLADGPLSEDTWDHIKNDIISYELVLLARNHRRRRSGA